jgi:pyrroloquinoline-quinone synthase
MTTDTVIPLESRLRDVLDERSLLKHPFYRAWTAGTLPIERLQEYARQYYHFEVAFPRFISAIHARTESPRVRQLLPENLWDEEHGERNHPALWLEFADALGVPAEEVRISRPNAETTALVNHFANACANAPVDEALAALFAYEGQVPAVAEQKIAGLRDLYGLQPSQYEFFTVHEAADAVHSGAELAAIHELCTSEDAVVVATRAAADRLLSFLDGCYAVTGAN